jgi:thioredoxin reductase (NADPH)
MDDEITLKPRHNYEHKADVNVFYDTIIVGAGVAGLSAAMYAARLGLKTMLIGETIGGTIALTSAVENYPGFVSVGGQKLAELLENHAMDYDIGILNDIVTDISIKEQLPNAFKVQSGKNEFKGRTVVLTTGAKVKKLGIPGEEGFTGRGVGYCAICDASMVEGKTVAVLGGGDSAVKEANLLANYAKKVYVVNNEELLHAEKPNMARLEAYMKEGRVEAINGAETARIDGDKRVERLVFKKPVDNRQSLDIDYVFIYIGHNPENTLAKPLGVKLNEKGEVIINKNSETNIPGFYAAGDVTDSPWKQAITAAAQGVTAAYHAYEHINKNFKSNI